MEYCDTGVAKLAIGIPTDEELEKLKAEGYTFMSKGKTVGEESEPFEIWVK